MSRSIRSYPQHQRQEVVLRRAKNITPKQMGLGTCSAFDAIKYFAKELGLSTDQRDSLLKQAMGK